MTKKPTQPTIHCAYDKLVPIESLVGNPRNPNTHGEQQIALLAKIITQQGWRAPITVSNRSGFIVRGHGRLQAAVLAGLTECPVDYQDYENEAAEWSDLIADNRIAELAEIDRPILKDLLEELDTGELDMELTGFNEDALAELMSEFHPEEEEPDLKDYAASDQYGVIVICDGEDHQKDVYDSLQGQGFNCKVVVV